MKDWFDTLESRERNFVLGGAVAVALAIFYTTIWAPLDQGHESLQSSVARWQQSLTDLRPLQGQLPAAATSSSPATNMQQTPVVIVDQTLRVRGLDRSLKRSQPTTSNGIRVEFENVAFDDLVLWLSDLSVQYGMHVASGSLSTSTQAGPGRINATLTLERGL